MADLDLRNDPAPNNTLQLKIPQLIPGLTSNQDGCLERLEADLKKQKKLQSAHIKRELDPPVLCLHYDPAQISLSEAQQIAERAGTKIASRYHHETHRLEGLDCSDCALVIEHSLQRMEGILGARVSYVDQTLQIEYDARQTSRLAVRRRVKQLGYQIPLTGTLLWYTENHELLFSLLCGLTLLTGWLSETFLGIPSGLSLGLYAAAYFFGGWHVTQQAWHTIRQRRFDVDLLMLAAALGAASLGQFAEGALLLFLFSLGHALEDRALERARRSIRALADLAPKFALVRRDGQEILLPVDEIAIGETVIIRPGERLPVDGVVLAGRSAVNQSPVTGESLPVDRSPGDPVYAGSVNGQGALDVQITRLARDSTLARVMRMVEQAQAQKSPTQQVTERFMSWFVPGVITIDLLLIFVPPLFGVPLSTSFLRAMTFLVAASPCALALGTPSAVLAGTARAARAGILVKGGAHLENLGRLHTIAFDKTGTITSGEIHVTDIIPTEMGGCDPEALLAQAAAVEKHSTHPLAQAVVRAAEERLLVLPAAMEVRSIEGRGLQGEIGNEPVMVGSMQWLEEKGLQLPGALLDRVNALEDQGKTVVLIHRAGSSAGLIALADMVRPEAQNAVTALREMGIQKIVMLSGDNERAAAHIAAQVGIQDYYAGLLPEDKLAAIRNLVQQDQAVSMVGDGVNDAPALAHATVGIAMGSAGSDAALETADVALMSSNLEKLPFAVGLGRATYRTIRQNLAIALGVIGILSLASVLGWAGIGLAILIHEGSTLVVVLNGLRLLSFRQWG